MTKGGKNAALFFVSTAFGKESLEGLYSRYKSSFTRAVELAVLGGVDVHLHTGTALKLTVFFVAAATLVVGLVAAN